jgi:uncharacterized phiE125 gp8 family phage protein
MLRSYIGRPSKRYRSIDVLEQPAVEPVSLREGKAQCRVSHDAEDDLLQGHIQAAREYVEARKGLCLIDTKICVVLDDWQAAGEIRLPRSPMSPTDGRQTVLVEYATSATEWATVDAGLYAVDRRSMPGIVRHVGFDWPLPSSREAAYRITYWAGYGATGPSVPRRYRNAILALAAHMYLNREAVGSSSLAKIPFMVDELIGHRSVEGYA